MFLFQVFDKVLWRVFFQILPFCIVHFSLVFEEFRSFHNSQNVFWLIAFSILSNSLDLYFLFFFLRSCLYIFRAWWYLRRPSMSLGSLCFWLDSCLSCFRAMTQSLSNHFSPAWFKFFCLGSVLARFRFDFIANLINILFKCLVARFRPSLLLGYWVCWKWSSMASISALASAAWYSAVLFWPHLYAGSRLNSIQFNSILFV